MSKLSRVTDESRHQLHSDSSGEGEHIQAHKASQDVATLMLRKLRRWPIGADDIELEHIHRCERFKSLGSSTTLLPYSLIFPELQGAAPYRSTAEDARIPLLRNCHSFQWSADI